MTKKFIVLALGIILFSSCKSKFDVNGEYIEKPVVHFLLDQGKTYHFLKLNKTFLKEGNANELAKNPSNSYFSDVVATVTEFKNGQNVKSWTLKDTIIHNKSAGIFYFPNQKLYFFKEANLDADALYKLKIVINGGEFVVTGRTKLISGVSITYPKPNLAFNFADNNVNANGYEITPIRFTSDASAAFYKVQIRFDYVEFTSSTDSTEKSLTWDIGTLSAMDISLNTPTISAKGEAFYEFLANKIKNDPDVIDRRVRGMSVILTAASQDLYTYMLASQPATSPFIQSKPSFSNLEGAIGIFSSRYTIEQYKPYYTAPVMRCLNMNSMKELCTGKYTGGLKFCSDVPTDVNQVFYCGN